MLLQNMVKKDLETFYVASGQRCKGRATMEEKASLKGHEHHVFLV